MSDKVIGILYETPSGEIVRTFGWDGRTREVRYYFDDGAGGRTASEAEFDTWKPRPDLEDFPNARDPRLPAIFDLVWDLKYQSELPQALEDASEEDARHMRTLLDRFGIVIDEVEPSERGELQAPGLR